MRGGVFLEQQKFIADLKNADFSFEKNDPNENYSALTNTFFNSGEACPTQKNKKK